jgi:RimJ/RimL family protein N-acetyltransferase
MVLVVVPVHAHRMARQPGCSTSTPASVVLLRTARSWAGAGGAEDTAVRTHHGPFGEKLLFMRIERCRADDLERLEAAIRSGRSRFHERRLARQQEGTSDYLIAWLDEVPVGHAEIRWNGCEAAEVRARFPGCPEISALEVWPEWLRSCGIGTELIGAAERRAVGRGIRRIGLGVADDNPRAAALYLRLGFAETGCRYLDRYQVVDDTGTRLEMADPCRFLVKDLRPG